jgi:hypothetical protein
MVTMSTYSNLMFYREKERMVEERLKLLESKQSCICVRGIDFASVSQIFNWILFFLLYFDR